MAASLGQFPANFRFSGALVEQLRVVLPLSRVFSNKWRLMLEVSRGLNPWCKQQVKMRLLPRGNLILCWQGIKLNDLGQVSNMIGQGDFMICNNLDSGYSQM